MMSTALAAGLLCDLCGHSCRPQLFTFKGTEQTGQVATNVPLCPPCGVLACGARGLLAGQL